MTKSRNMDSGQIKAIAVGCLTGVACFFVAMKMAYPQSPLAQQESKAPKKEKSSKKLKKQHSLKAAASFVLASNRMSRAAKIKEELQKDEEEAPGVTRPRNDLEKALRDHIMEANEMLKALHEQKKADSDDKKVGFFVPALKDCAFVGHLVTDLDSIAGAIGAADLYGGVALRASEVNSETAFALEKWGFPAPPPVEGHLGARSVCLVDHQQTSQLNAAIPLDRVVGCIDHHALQNSTIVTDKPIYVDIRPWGSMATIIAHNYLTLGREIPKPIAGMLLCAILSDTLNLQSPTTTDWDRKIMAVLVEIAEVEDVNQLASDQFRAKSKEFETMSAHQVVVCDQKVFRYEGLEGQCGIAVVETTCPGVVLERRADIVEEMKYVKQEKGLSMLFLMVVDIVAIRSNLLICGKKEKSLAVACFGGEFAPDGLTMDLGDRVSRKKDFSPPLGATIKAGWKPAPADLDEPALPPTLKYTTSEDQNGFVRRKSLVPQKNTKKR